jgi:hypothetical protein
MLGSIGEAFSRIRASRRDDLIDWLKEAFVAGWDQHWIDAAERPEIALRYARAKAVIHEAECQYPDDRSPDATEFEAGKTAYRLAKLYAIGAAEASACALDALAELGFKPPMRAAAFVMDRARAGARAREEAEAFKFADSSADNAVVLAILAEAGLA